MNSKINVREFSLNLLLNKNSFNSTNLVGNNGIAEDRKITHTYNTFMHSIHIYSLIKKIRISPLFIVLVFFCFFSCLLFVFGSRFPRLCPMLLNLSLKPGHVCQSVPKRRERDSETETLPVSYLTSASGLSTTNLTRTDHGPVRPGTVK